MTFANPAGFLLLFIIPLLLLIHSLKSKIKIVQVPALYLWKDAKRAEEQGFRFKRLKQNLPLLIQILIIFFSALALSNPIFTSYTENPGQIVLILDTSASMNTKTDRGTRFEVARKAALKLIDELPQQTEFLIVESATKPVIRQGFTGDKSTLRRLVASLSAREVAGNLEEALYLALSFLGDREKGWIYVISDGAGINREKLVGVHQRIKPIWIEGGGTNYAITRFTLREEQHRKQRFQILIELKNFTDRPAKIPLELFADEVPFYSKNINLKKHGKTTVIIPYSGLMAGVLKAKILIPDDLDIDNEAFAVLNRSRDIYVYLVTKNNYFLEKILSIYPNTVINRSSEIIPSSWPQLLEQNDIVIVDNLEIPPVTNGNLILINATAPNLGLSKTKELHSPVIVDWDRDHPLLQDVDFSGVAIKKATGLVSGGQAQPLVKSSQAGLVYTIETSNLRAVYLGFNLQDSNFPLKVAFPVFFNNIIKWLYPGETGHSLASLKTGETVSLRLKSKTKGISIRKPSKSVENFVTENSVVEYKEVDEVGIYKVKEGRQWYYFAANLESEMESDINPQPDTNKSPLSPPDSFSKIKKDHFLWIILTMAMIGFLIMEWIVWLKRNRGIATDPL